MSDRPKVVITDFDYGDNDIEKAIIEAAGGQVVSLQAKCEEDLFEHAEDCFAMINQYARVGAKTIARMKQCKVIARYGVGVDIVDVKTATERGIMVTNVQDYCTDEVADHAVSLWLTLVRKLPQFNASTHKGNWSWRSERPVYRMRGRVMGIVSLGKIGQAIAERARPFGVRIIAYDPYLDPAKAEALGVELVDKETLVSESNYILMQAPMTPETRHFLSDAEFAAMKPGGILVLTGRGPTVDNKALYRALTEGTLAGAGLDDPEEEPAKRAEWDPADNPIFTLPNVIVTPHTAYYSEESIQQARETAASEVARALRGERPKNLLNPETLA